MKRLRNVAILSVALTLSLSATSLSTYINSTYNNGLVVGDKVFYNFSWFSSCTVNGIGADCATLGAAGSVTGFDASSIQINPVISGNLYGFDLTGGVSATSNPGNVLIDVTLKYQAETTRNDLNTPGSGLPLISDVHLAAAGTRNPNDSSNPPSFTIGESVYDLTGSNQLANLQVTNPPPVLLDAAIINPTVSGVSVIKDIKVVSGAGTANGTLKYADVTSIEQLLSQVPEPRAYGALLAFLVGIVVFNRKRKLA